MTATASYRTRSIKRARRSKTEIEVLKSDLYAILRAEQPMTIRHLFYRAVSAGLIPKTEAAYKGIVCRLVTQMRKGGDLPFHWLVDSTRWMRKPDSYSSVGQMLSNCRDTYRRALWDSQPVYAEAGARRTPSPRSYIELLTSSMSRLWSVAGSRA